MVYTSNERWATHIYCQELPVYFYLSVVGDCIELVQDHYIFCVASLQHVRVNMLVLYYHNDIGALKIMTNGN